MQDFLNYLILFNKDTTFGGRKSDFWEKYEQNIFYLFSSFHLSTQIYPSIHSDLFSIYLPKFSDLYPYIYLSIYRTYTVRYIRTLNLTFAPLLRNNHTFFLTIYLSSIHVYTSIYLSFIFICTNLSFFNNFSFSFKYANTSNHKILFNQIFNDCVWGPGNIGGGGADNGEVELLCYSGSNLSPTPISSLIRSGYLISLSHWAVAVSYTHLTLPTIYSV